MAWRVAESLETLRKQLNTAFPNRSKISDGGIGDARHQASKSSDHNPHVRDSKGIGVVTARDFTHDPKNGLDCNKLAQWLIESRDKRIKYIIWNKRILSSKNSPWKWRPYSGSNAHSHHLHLSVDADPKLYDSTKLWDLDVAKTEPPDDIAKVTNVKPTVSVNPVQNISDDEINETIEQNINEIPADENLQLPPSSTDAHSADTSAIADSQNISPPEAIEGQMLTSEPVGDAPDAKPRSWIKVEDLKPFVLKWLKRIWSTITGFNTAQLTALTGSGITFGGRYWWAWIAAAVILFILTVSAALIVSGVLGLIWWKNRGELSRAKELEATTQADPTMFNVGLEVNKKF